MRDYQPGCRNPDDPGDEPEEDDSIITCWCGVRGTYDELFDDAGLPPGGCGGMGVVHCECGGDFCVCHHHGETECPGCLECEGDGDGEGWDDYDPEYDDVGGEG